MDNSNSNYGRSVGMYNEVVETMEQELSKQEILEKSLEYEAFMDFVKEFNKVKKEVNELSKQMEDR